MCIGCALAGAFDEAASLFTKLPFCSGSDAAVVELRLDALELEVAITSLG
jgi:hypothetical protein